MKELLDQFDAHRITTGRLVADFEALVGLLSDEADAQWIDELQSECNRLEFVNAAVIDQGRDQLIADETEEVTHALQTLRLVLTPY